VGDSGAGKKVTGRLVERAAKQVVQFGPAESGASGEGGDIGKVLRRTANVGRQRVHTVGVRVETLIKVVGAASAARAQTGLLRGVFRVEERNVFGLRFSGGAGRQTVNTGRPHAREEASVIRGVGREKPREHRLARERRR